MKITLQKLSLFVLKNYVIIFYIFLYCTFLKLFFNFDSFMYVLFVEYLSAKLLQIFDCNTHQLS